MTPLTNSLLHWFNKNKRSLPWRKNYLPYHVWISEIMLQQTQMDRVVSFFTNWITKFPTIESVAMAPEDEILKAWEGLGYYSRARNIQKCAHILVHEYGGHLPKKHDALLKLPGIGPYTAGAIMSIAFNENYCVVDANVKRVFARLFDCDHPTTSPALKSFCTEKAAELLPARQARNFNQALMEFGALICLPRSPQCGSCPIAEHCQSLANDKVMVRPVLAQKKKIIPVTVVAGVICHKGLSYIQKRLPDAAWANLWEFPGGHLEKGERPEDAVIREIREETEFEVTDIKMLCTAQHSFTRYRYTLYAYSCKLTNSSPEPILHAAQEYAWLPLNDLTAYAFSSGHRKLLTFLLQNRDLLVE